MQASAAQRFHTSTKGVLCVLCLGRGWVGECVLFCCCTHDAGLNVQHCTMNVHLTICTNIICTKQDSFPPAKIAGLRAMIATSQYHSAEDAALRILPAVAPLAIDPVGEVCVLCLSLSVCICMCMCVCVWLYAP